MYSVQLNPGKALQMYLRAGELGFAEGYCSVAHAFHLGEGVDVDMKKAKIYYELAAKGGYAEARHNLGVMEAQEGNISRAIKHFVIAARSGLEESLTSIKGSYMNGYISKDEYEKTLRAYQKSQYEMKSDGRSKAKMIKERIRQRH